MAYNRKAAVEYARKWAFSRNPAFFDFSQLGGDCTNFASQCIYAGIGVMNYTPVFGWYYNSINSRSPAWTGVNELYNFLINNRGEGPRAVEVPLSEIQAGDIVQIRFAGQNTFGHCPVVVRRGFGTPGTVLIAAHTNDAYNRALSTYMYAELRPLHIL